MNNYITLYGEPLEYPHQVSVDKRGVAYYGFNMATERVSGIKDITQVNIAPNEFRVILASLQAVQLINQGELEVDQETKQKCSSYLFTVNKLVSVFNKQMS